MYMSLYLEITLKHSSCYSDTVYIFYNYNIIDRRKTKMPSSYSLYAKKL